MGVDTQNPHARILSGKDAIPRSENFLGGKLKLPFDDVSRLVNQDHRGARFLFHELARFINCFLFAQPFHARLFASFLDHRPTLEVFIRRYMVDQLILHVYNVVPGQVSFYKARS